VTTCGNSLENCASQKTNHSDRCCHTDKSSCGQCTALLICSAALHVPSNADNNAFPRLSVHSKTTLRHTRWAVPTAAIACSQSDLFTHNTEDMGGMPHVWYLTLLCAQLLPSNTVTTLHAHSNVNLLFRLVCMYLQEGGVAFLLANLPGTVDHSTVGSLRPLGHEAGLDDIQGGGGNTCD